MSMERHDHGDLEHVLRALREEQGTVEQARALEQRLLDKLGEKALVAPLAPAVSHVGRLSLLLGVTVLIGLGVLIGRPQQAPLSPAEPRLEAHVAPVPAPPALVLRPPPMTPTPSIALAPQHLETKVVPPRRPPRRHPPRLGTPRAPELRVIQPPRESELTMLQRARVALRESPATALSITDQHLHDYPAGVFVQEREVLAIEALLRQRRTPDALARAERFVAEQPSSTYALQLREMLLTKPRIVAAITAEPRGTAP
jgi:hypothetical protein